MARACTICTHPRRIEINHALVESIAPGGPIIRDIAKRFASSEDALHRHLSKHLKPAIERAAAVRATAAESTKPQYADDPQAIAEAQDAIAEEAKPAGKLLDRVEYLWNESVDGLKETKAKDHRAHASYIGQARKVAELGGLATGELRRDDPGSQRTVVVVLPPAGLPGMRPRPALEDGDGPILDLVPTA